MRLVSLIALMSIVLFRLGGCSFFYERVDAGPGALEIWSVQYRRTHRDRLPSPEDLTLYRAVVIARIERHIATRSVLSERRKLELRSLTVYRGMIKDEVQLLVGEPSTKIQDPKALARQAGKYWPELQGRVQEAWVYNRYTLFFDGDSVIDIHKSGTDVL